MYLCSTSGRARPVAGQAQARSAGLLPDHADCLAHAVRLRGS